jgi:hypothetical protein
LAPHNLAPPIAYTTRRNDVRHDSVTCVRAVVSIDGASILRVGTMWVPPIITDSPDVRRIEDECLHLC